MSPKLLAAEKYQNRRIVHVGLLQMMTLAMVRARGVAAENERLKHELKIVRAERDRIFELHDEYVRAVERRRAAEEAVANGYRAKLEWLRLKDERPRYLH